MNVIGIIVEYNPIHNGHIYHMDKIKELYSDSIVIAIMTSSFCERGDVSILNKWDKTSLALNNGCDIVIELPYIYTCQSADVFSKYSIKILNELGIKKIVFGSESNDIEMLKKIANDTLNNESYDDLIKKYIDLGNSYPKAVSMASLKTSNVSIDKSNDILGLCYIKEILKNNYDIEPVCIKRTNNYNDKKITGNISSGTSIRQCLKERKDITKYVPNGVIDKVYDINKIDDNYFKLLKYKILSSGCLDNYALVDEGIHNRIKKYIFSSNNLDELIMKIKTKRYTYSKIKRILTNILNDITKKDISNAKEYIRILGFSEQGRKYINKVKKDINIPLYNTFNQDLELEKKITHVYSLLVEDNSLIDLEYKNKPIIK